MIRIKGIECPKVAQMRDGTFPSNGSQNFLVVYNYYDGYSIHELVGLWHVKEQVCNIQDRSQEMWLRPYIIVDSDEEINKGDKFDFAGFTWTAVNSTFLFCDTAVTRRKSWGSGDWLDDWLKDQDKAIKRV